MKFDLAQKARDRRVEALSGLPMRKTRQVAMGGLNLLPALGAEDVSAVFATSNGHFEQNIFSI